ncbi:MAG: O-antigen polymerase [Phycisphaerales bacterium]
MYVLVILSGCWFAWKLLHSSWPGWTAFPLVLIVVQITNDLGVAPLVFDLSGYEYPADSLLRRAHAGEALCAGGLILVSYLMIAGGLISVRLLSGWSGQSGTPQTGGQYCPYVAKRAWYASLLFFALGSAVNLILICMLLRGRSLIAITFEKALMTDEALVESPAYYILRMLAHLMVIGALGMVFFSQGRHVRARMSIVAVLLAIGVAALYGGRQGIVTGMVSFLLLYRYGVGPISWWRVACCLILCMFVLGGVAHLRGYNLMTAGGSGGIDTFRLLRATVVGYCRMDDAAWVLRTVPDVIPYTGVLNAAGALGRFVPSLRIPGTDTLYMHVVERFYGGVNPSAGIGGANYSTAAELYAWGGWLSLVAFGYLIGVFFGAIFEWQRRCSRNPFLVLLVVLVAVRVFFFGVHARMPNILYEVGVYVLAVAALAAISVPSRRVVPFVLLFAWNAIPILFWKALGIEELRLVVLGSVPLLYFWGVQSLRITDRYFREGFFLDNATTGCGSQATRAASLTSGVMGVPNGI